MFFSAFEGIIIWVIFNLQLLLLFKLQLAGDELCVNVCSNVSMYAANIFCKLACSALNLRKMDVSLFMRGGGGGGYVQAITDLIHADHYCTLKAGTLKSRILFACAMYYNIVF